MMRYPELKNSDEEKDRELYEKSQMNAGTPAFLSIRSFWLLFGKNQTRAFHLNL